MPGVSAPESRGPVVAIIGGGASGTLAAVHLLRSAAARQYSLRITLIDRYGRHGLGQAYATTHPDHLLNAPAGQMSALAGDPDHLIRWAGPEVTDGTGFLPRQLYGRYLRDTLSAAERHAQPLSWVTRVTSDVVAVRRNSDGRPLRLVLADGRRIDADIAVLATGSPAPALPFPVPRSPRIIADPWAPGALDAAADGSPVMIVGTGLTMIDVAVAVTSGSRPATVHAVSRHGLLPRTHRGPPPAGGSPLWLPALADPAGPVSLGELMWQVRCATAGRPGNWQQVMDALRPFVPGLWQRMPDRDKRLFLRHVARYWEVHRHRVPPATASRITALRGTGQLSVRPGQVTAVDEQAGQLRVRVSQGSGTVEHTVGWLINGTGAATDITAAADPLLGDLFARGLARPDPLGLGIDASTDGSVLDASGTPSSTLCTLGPPLRGLWYETTAIPEIREQAAALACRLIAGRQACEHPGSAA